MKLKTAIKILIIDVGVALWFAASWYLLSNIIEPAMALLTIWVIGGIILFLVAGVDEIKDRVEYILFGSEPWYPKPLSKKEIEEFGKRKIIYPE